MNIRSFFKSFIFSFAALVFVGGALAQQTEEIKKLVESAPVAAITSDKSASGMPFCTDLKVFKEKCALTNDQIAHMVKGRTISGPQLGYSITKFVFAENGDLTTNGRSGGKWKVESDLLYIQNHWSSPFVTTVSNEDLNSFGLSVVGKVWFSWK